MLAPVVLYAPASDPKKVLFKLPVDALIATLALPAESLSITDAVDTAVMALIDSTTVPSKSVVGVTVKLPVVVVVGPKAPLAVIVARDCPPNARVKLPAVRPVTVYVI